MQNAVFIPAYSNHKDCLMMAPSVFKGVRKQVSTLKNHWGTENYYRLSGRFYQKLENVYIL